MPASPEFNGENAALYHPELDDKPREACGVFGVYAPGMDGAQLTYLGLQNVQHRGQDAAGIAVWSSAANGFITQKNHGLVSDVFPDAAKALAQVSDGAVVVGHNRYGTYGSGSETIQPLGQNPLSHNGHIESMKTIGLDFGVDPSTYGSDSQCLSMIVDQLTEKYDDVVLALQELLPRVEGAYSIVIADRKQRLIAARDRNGFRPLSIGRFDQGGYVVASETTAVEMVGASVIGDVNPGEIVVIDGVGEENLKRFTYSERVDPKLCSFEFAYFARPDSVVGGQNVHIARERMGMRLAEEHPVEADMVIGVPDSGLSAAMGYSKQSGIPFEFGLTKSRYIPRTFIKSKQLSREQAVQLKLHANRSVIDGKRLIVSDDSIVRGTTTRILVKMLYEAGATEVHLRIPSPPNKFPCFYGMDTGRPSELLAYQRTLEEMRLQVGADSLQFISQEGFEESIGLGLGKLCFACMDGKYPTPVRTSSPASQQS